VTTEACAIQIARDWNVKASGSGFVTRFVVDENYAARFPKKSPATKPTKNSGAPQKTSKPSTPALSVLLR
jgi:hypothetical protein